MVKYKDINTANNNIPLYDINVKSVEACNHNIDALIFFVINSKLLLTILYFWLQIAKSMYQSF